jgi:2-keto-4-pentenoate hydratase/2-oxohepta-3-ene-1,7-dioic acid hydratase in catechol pathway
VRFRPGKIIGVGKNYRAHAAELDSEVPAEPLLFFKAPSALIGDGDDFPRPSEFERVDYEGEIGVVIGKTGRRIRAAGAMDHVLGFVCVNDFTIRDLQRKDSQWARAKGFDGSCAVGPRIVAGIPLDELSVTTRIGGEVRQSAPASQMVWSIPAIIEFASQYMTLEEGDLICTGTPAGVGNLEPGDLVEVEIPGVGVLCNSVVAEL